MPHNRSQDGMTLVETLVTIALLTVLMAAVMFSIMLLYKYNAYAFAQAFQLQNARNGVEHLVRDMREMIYSDTGAFPLQVMEPHKVGFYSDIDRDNSVEYVEYELVATTTTLEKRIYNATGTPVAYDLSSPDTVQIMSEYVQNYDNSQTTFMYLDENGDEIIGLHPLDVRAIVSQVIINIDPIRDPGQYMLRSSATLRNIK